MITAIRPIAVDYKQSDKSHIYIIIVFILFYTQNADMIHFD